MKPFCVPVYSMKPSFHPAAASPAPHQPAPRHGLARPGPASCAVPPFGGPSVEGRFEADRASRCVTPAPQALCDCRALTPLIAFREAAPRARVASDVRRHSRRFG